MLREAASILKRQPDPTDHCWIHGMRMAAVETASIMRVCGRSAEAVEALEEALAFEEAARPVDLTLDVPLGLAVACFETGQFDRAL